jgi:hypothetical protein
MSDIERIATPQAHWRGREFFTGEMRWAYGDTDVDPVLQQEWAVEWGNQLGTAVTRQWFDVPAIRLGTR